MIRLIYKSFLVYSQRENKYFYEEFGDSVNIVYGKNTSGKSTLFQLLNYTFGINDEKNKLKEILDLDISCRLDCDIIVGKQKIDFIIIRKNDKILIKYGDKPFESFDGIDGNNSFEHNRLKEYIRNLFNFTLYLEQKGEYKAASIETIFLPYYIPQDVGWIMIRKSFKGLEFYKNFKYDFLDYYLGITNDFDRKEKIELEKELKEIQANIEFYQSIETNSTNLLVSKFIDEKFEGKSKEYIDKNKNKKEQLIKHEKEYVLKCNELAYLKERRSILQRIKKNTEQQNPDTNGKCPTCNRSLEYSIEKAYEYYQDFNDTTNEIGRIDKKIKKLQRDIDKLEKVINESHQALKQEYEVLKQYSEEKITYDKWLEYKIDAQIVDKLNTTVAKLNKELQGKRKILDIFKTDEEIKEERTEKEKEFFKIFQDYTKKLNVKDFFDDERFRNLYRMSVFPKQGVELHKTILAYNFAFNRITQNTGVHRLPLVLDAIFKEDIDQDNKNEIINFISNYKPTDTQMFISIAESENEDNIKNYNELYFNGKAHLICIGEKKKERAFLSKIISQVDIIDDTNKILYEY